MSAPPHPPPTAAVPGVPRRPPSALVGPLRVLEGQLVTYRGTWRGSITSTFLTPILFLSAMGLGLGSLVDQGGGLGGVSYLQFYASGLLAAQAMQTGVGDATYPVMAGIKWLKTYDAVLATPLRTRDLVFGHAGFVALRITLASVVFVVIATLFGAFALLPALTAVPVVVLCGQAYTLPVMAFTAAQERETALPGLFRFGVVPMFLLSGTFFPIEQLPSLLQPAAQVVPLWHAIEIVRGITLGQPPAWPWPAHLLYLLAWVGVGAALATRVFRRRLVV